MAEGLPTYDEVCQDDTGTQEVETYEADELMGGRRDTIPLDNLTSGDAPQEEGKTTTQNTVYAHRELSRQASILSNGASDDCCDRIGNKVCGKDKSTFYCWCCFMVFCLCGGIFAVIHGNNAMSDGREYRQEATTEMCLLTSYKQRECTYCCDNDWGRRRRNLLDLSVDDSDDGCETCKGVLYEYTATVESKCGMIELESHPGTSECPRSLKTIGQEYKCYVLDCEDAEFLLQHPDEVLAGGIVSIVIGSFLLCYGCCYLCGCLCNCIDNMSS